MNGKAFQAMELLALLLLPLNTHSWGAKGVGVQSIGTMDAFGEAIPDLLPNLTIPETQHRGEPKARVAGVHKGKITFVFFLCVLPSLHFPALTLPPELQMVQQTQFQVWSQVNNLELVLYRGISRTGALVTLIKGNTAVSVISFIFKKDLKT